MQRAVLASYHSRNLVDSDRHFRCEDIPPDVTVLDGGSTCTVVTDPAKCSNIRAANIDLRVGGNTLKCTSIGDVYYSQRQLGGDVKGLLIKDARIVPSFGINVLGENVFLDKGATVIKRPDPVTSRVFALVEHEDRVLLRCERHASGLFLLYGDDSCLYTHAACSGSACDCAFHQDFSYTARNHTEQDVLMEWHVRLGHRNFRDVQHFLQSLGIPFKQGGKPPFCVTCVEAKSHRHPLRRNPLPRLRAPRPGYCLHSDMCGPFRHPTRGGAFIYFNILVDDYSGRIWLKLMNSEAEFFDHLTAVVAEIEAEFGYDRVVAQLHTDAATYFEKSKEVQDFCRKKGVRQTFSPPDTPSLNSIAERTIRVIKFCEMARAMMIHAGSPASLWGEAIIYATFILNNLPYKTGSLATRNSLFYNKPPPTDLPVRVVPFGCAAWAHLASGDGGKSISNSKGLACLVLGWDERRGSWRLCRRDNYSKLKFSGHVTFDMDHFPGKDAGAEQSAEAQHEFIVDNRQCNAPITPDPDEPPVALAASLFFFFLR